MQRVLDRQKAEYTLVGREELGRQHISRVIFLLVCVYHMFHSNGVGVGSVCPPS